MKFNKLLLVALFSVTTTFSFSQFSKSIQGEHKVIQRVLNPKLPYGTFIIKTDRVLYMVNGKLFQKFFFRKKIGEDHYIIEQVKTPVTSLDQMPKNRKGKLFDIQIKMLKKNQIMLMIKPPHGDSQKIIIK